MILISYFGFYKIFISICKLYSNCVINVSIFIAFFPLSVNRTYEILIDFYQ